MLGCGDIVQMSNREFNNDPTGKALISEAEGSQGRTTGIRDGGYHGVAKGSKGGRVSKGVLIEAEGSRRRAASIGVGRYGRLSKGSKMDLVRDGVSEIGATPLQVANSSTGTL